MQSLSFSAATAGPCQYKRSKSKHTRLVQMVFRSEGPPFNSHVREGVDRERSTRVEARRAGTCPGERLVPRLQRSLPFGGMPDLALTHGAIKWRPFGPEKM